MINAIPKRVNTRFAFFLALAFTLALLCVYANVAGAPPSGAPRTTGNGSAEVPGLTSHAPIYINGNANFTAANGVVGGSGTENNPYIIEGWDINASNTNGIEIRNTDAYFIIRNCMLHDGRGYFRGGICLYFVTHGAIENVTSYNNYYGLWLFKASNNEIHHCNIYNNAQCGIYNSNSGSKYEVNATYCWWGSADGPSYVGTGSGDNVSSNVLYELWLTEPWQPPPTPIVCPDKPIQTRR